MRNSRAPQYRLPTAAGLKPDDVKQWMVSTGLFAALFERRSTHNELLKRSGDIIRFAASCGMLTLEALDLVWEASQGAGEETQGIVFKVCGRIAAAHGVYLLLVVEGCVQLGVLVHLCRVFPGSELGAAPSWGFLVAPVSRLCGRLAARQLYSSLQPTRRVRILTVL